jgi:hypothetical protein
MSVVIGPVLRHADAYSFDTWTAGKGVSGGYPYRRIEDAYYARNAEIKASARGRAPSAIVCQTLDEFIAKSSGYEMLAAA